MVKFIDQLPALYLYLWNQVKRKRCESLPRRNRETLPVSELRRFQRLVSVDVSKHFFYTVRAMYGVGESTAAQLIAEIGDVRRFPRRSSIVGFAGVDPGVNESGKHSAVSVPTTKRGSPHLRKTLYQIVCTYLRKAPADEPVYQFLDKKRREGKPYFVYMTAAQNKFLCIYYARVKECLEVFNAQQVSEQQG